MDTHIVFYDAQCPLCRTVKTVVTAFDWRNELSWFPVQYVSEKTREKASKIVNMYDEIYVLTKEEEVLIGFQSIRKILSVLPAFFWLAWLMKPQFVEWIGEPTYQSYPVADMIGLAGFPMKKQWALNKCFYGKKPALLEKLVFYRDHKFLFRISYRMSPASKERMICHNKMGPPLMTL